MMIPYRDTFITTLIQSKLHIRRMYRAWRRPRPRQKQPSPKSQSSTLPFSYTSEKHSHVSTRAQLPCPPPDQYSYTRFIPSFLFLFSLVIRLYKISFPPSVVFDEVHFLRFIRAYYYGKYFFDIHPPLGKLILLMITYIFCGEPSTAYNSNDVPFGKFHYVPLRVTSAIFGSTIAPLTFLICRQMGLSLPASLFPAITQAVEHTSIIETRFVLLDGQLIAFMALSLLLALRMWEKPRGKRWGLVIGTALAGAAAICVKWTALATPGIIAIISLIGKPFPKNRLLWSEMGVAGLIAFVFYTATFWIHFKLLPLAGDGDPFMKVSFRRALPGDKFYDASAKMPGFWKNFSWLNYEMFVANKGVSRSHTWGSRWYQWVVNQRGLLFFNENVGKSFRVIQQIYLIVNPAVTVFTIVSLLAFIGIVLGFYVPQLRKKWASRSGKSRVHGFTERGIVIFAGYFLNLLPYIAVERCTFLYHYLPSLFYALLAVANFIDILPSMRVQTVTSSVACTLVLIGFVIWNPWIYGKALDYNDHNWRRLWDDSWL